MIFGSEDFWEFRPHPEVWILLLGLLALGFYATRVVSPKLESKGLGGIKKSHKRWFTAALILMWVTSDWPLHDISEEYLYSLHMVQHTLLTLVIPPMFLLATPEWFARLILGDGAVKKWVFRLAHPIPAAVMFNGYMALTHWSGIVNASVNNPLLHYVLHFFAVVTALIFWMSVCGPIPELRMDLPAQMVYLFLSSVIPTIPGAWLTFADGVVYDAYDKPARMFGMSVTLDQQAAGLFMKLGTGVYLWTLITLLFFRWVGANERKEKARRAAVREKREAETLTWAEVEAELETSPPAPIERPPD